jgi:hypothetical protein
MLSMVTRESNLQNNQFPKREDIARGDANENTDIAHTTSKRRHASSRRILALLSAMRNSRILWNQICSELLLAAEKSRRRLPQTVADLPIHILKLFARLV